LEDAYSRLWGPNRTLFSRPLRKNLAKLDGPSRAIFLAYQPAIPNPRWGKLGFSSGL